ncbi:hypothetical protein TBLA_0E02570 [Henningerozyma blattae CBS 6284]|uniref:Ubiquitin carboxyl-terminal hydrolase n=1 Tax=Henningerozyma blattae (strain ATCC 34711 / CBS 6284 / DSM 70876 / NBRC 10599 / NRRL Y-10934 / UCD 77-7) TaxID=1071380 RepID=I2H4L1_HENB6|nr:hypothetical protein TBLA_0E02570 [Tetrapisispora blattae CBS 6284]CCH61313.1 hypothetical protein TBLA_0E02570 [Tetrapisispora blattae CBS 6284]
MTEILASVSIPSVISKEECIYCYETPINDCHQHEITDSMHKLNICFRCWQPTCERHVSLHKDVTKNSCDSSHTTFFTIAKVKKVTDPKKTSDDSNNKKLKLQIVDKTEDELFDTLWQITKWASNEESFKVVMASYDGSTIPPFVQEKVDLILKAKSQHLVDQTNSWQLEINTCKHIKEIQNNISTTSSNINLHKCKSCDLKENLWLCLHCGNVGCGREQVGIEGNSHALRHYEDSKSHPVAVKLGSLSDKSSDIYCYECDDDVKFDNLSTFKKVLSQYGINLDNVAASEKTLVELQVEQNMNWNFQMVDSEGKELKSLKAGDDFGVGLINLGNSCYLNSILQCFYNGGIPNWSVEELGTEFPLSVVYPSNNLKCQLLKLTNAMKIESDLYPNGIKPTAFKKCIGGSHNEFSSNRQQDAMEFLTYMIDVLDNKIFNTANNPNDTMRFIMEDKIQCQKCKGVKYMTEPCEAIQLPLIENTEPQDLLERIHSYFQGTSIEFNCPKCKEVTLATKTPSFKTLPDTLIISPIRIKLVNWTPVKTNNILTIPGLDNSVAETDLLDMSQYISGGYNPELETLLDDAGSDSESEFKPNEMLASQMMEMGFTLNAVSRSLYATDNCDLEAATNWLFQHIEDPDINDEFIPPKASGSAKNDIDPNSLNSMLSMGLDPKLCRKALILNSGDVNRSVEWVFNNMDDDGELPKEEPTTKNNNKDNYGNLNHVPYKLTAVVCHKGQSAHSGHYVAFIRKIVDGKLSWVLYNDEKIVIADSLKEVQKNGYIFFYSRTSDW